jgi:hypothetical protein
MFLDGMGDQLSRLQEVEDSVIVNVYSKENAPVGFRRLKD